MGSSLSYLWLLLGLIFKVNLKSISKLKINWNYCRKNILDLFWRKYSRYIKNVQVCLKKLFRSDFLWWRGQCFWNNLHKCVKKYKQKYRMNFIPQFWFDAWRNYLEKTLYNIFVYNSKEFLLNNIHTHDTILCNRS